MTPAPGGTSGSEKAVWMSIRTAMSVISSSLVRWLLFSGQFPTARLLQETGSFSLV
jgi:hypothetical protein